MPPRKVRSLDVRIREEQEKMDKLQLRRKIQQLREKLPKRKRRK